MKVTTNGTPGAKVTKLELSKETVRSLRVRADVRTGVWFPPSTNCSVMKSAACPLTYAPTGP